MSSAARLTRLREDLVNAARQRGYNAIVAVERIVDEYIEEYGQSHLRMGKVKIGDFVQVNKGPVAPIALNGVIVLEVADERLEKPLEG